MSRRAPLFALLAAACGGQPSAPVTGAADERADAARVRPSCHFVDATAQSGLRFTHVTGGTGEKLLPETMGSGAALFDADGDGHLDAFLVNGTSWSDRGEPGACALFLGRGDGTFEDVTGPWGAGLSLYGMGCAAADHDGDGDADLYVTALGDNVLLENRGDTFADGTEVAGVAGGRWRDEAGASHPEWSTGTLWFDGDRDGDLDLFVANYCEWTPALEVFTTLDGTHKAFTTPDAYRGLPCRLFLNDGTGRYAEAVGAGVSEVRGKALGVAQWDFDADGWPDVAVANDTRPNFLFHNLGDGRFEELGERWGVAYDEDGRARAGMGIDAADLGDGPLFAIGNFAGESLSLFRWRGDGFEGAARAAGLDVPTFLPLAFGLAFRDLDLDGAQDLVVVNGHIEPDVARFVPGQSHAQSAQVFLGDGRGGFRVADAGPAVEQPRVGRGLALGDVDEDGDLDLLVTTNGGAPALLVNQTLPGTARRSLRVVLEDPSGANREALGACVTLTWGGRVQTRRVRTGSSYLSQSELALTFGVPPDARGGELRVAWPDGGEETFALGEPRGTVRVARGDGVPAAASDS